MILRYDDSLAHFGVKGMRWGVRKKSHSKPRKSVHEMSNRELQDHILRRNLEKQYTDLYRPQTSRSRIAKKYRARLEDQLTKEAARITSRVIISFANSTLKQMRDPSSSISLKQGAKIFNAYKNYVR